MRSCWRWRFFTYDLYLLVGIADTIVTTIRRKHHPAERLAPTCETKLAEEEI